MIRTARVYALPDESLGARWLVDRLWPRGIAKVSLGLAGWARDAAPSDDLRRWFGHDVDRWPEFRERYEAELEASPDACAPLLEAAGADDLVLLYAAHDVEHNNAVVLADHLRRRLLAGRTAAVSDEGGGPVCLLHLVCPSCGHLDDSRTATCPRCGADLDRDEA